MITKGYGITVSDIDDGCPADFEPYEMAHNEELKEHDFLLYNMGLYNMSAFATVIANGFGKKETYIKEPLLTKYENENNEVAAESREEIAIIEMNQWMRRCKNYGLESSPL